MQIRRLSSSGVAASGKVKAKGSSHRAFAPEVSDEASASVATQAQAGVASMQGVDALLSVQQMGDATQERRRGLQHGNLLLDNLEALKLDLLMGRVSVDRLQAIQARLDMRQPSGVAALDKVIDEIELRARIELAKLGIFAE
ncbi:flagellar assembly protein FliX [Polycladidibacter hongkongensis]|uniref:flagellar assembly protein FliX n=1 Tax=Polycladidibacter hongkongensis TaxID=1647556 RepID=UPI000AD94E97|nr:flagellar assembly protein FliX [Pseudovibrio hongkongensis]